MEKQKKAAFYCHGFHTSCSEVEYLIQMQKRLSSYPNMSTWETEVFREKTLRAYASGRFNQKKRSGRGSYSGSIHYLR